jgi:glycosyltransferase involved in cell wall biosynthesis
VGSFKASLDLITVVSSPSIGFELTRNSIEALMEGSNTINWYVVIGEWDDNLRMQIEKVQAKNREFVHVVAEEAPGIYTATNQGLRLIQGDYFAVIHSGDVLYTNILDLLGKLSNDKVHCFETHWHNKNGLPLKVTRRLPLGRYAGRMPHHQTMIFPQSFSTMEYDTRFPIAADQHLKLRLWKSEELAIYPDVIGSSLIGGVTTRKLKPSQVLVRYRETRNIMLDSFPRVWAESLSLTYLANYLKKAFFNAPRESR